MIPKIQYDALLQAVQWVREGPAVSGGDAMPEEVKQLGDPLALPAEWKDEFLEDESVMRKMHVVLFDIHMVEGKLVCPESGREFPVERGIPNMLLNDDEV